MSDKLYNKIEFYNYCEQNGVDGCDIVLGFDDTLKTLEQWCEYLAETYEQLNDDLRIIGESHESIERNEAIVKSLRLLVCQ